VRTFPWAPEAWRELRTPWSRTLSGGICCAWAIFRQLFPWGKAGDRHSGVLS